MLPAIVTPAMAPPAMNFVVREDMGVLLL